MTHFTDQDIGDFAEEVISCIEGMKRALRFKLPEEIAASKEREKKLLTLSTRILEELGRRQPPAVRGSKQLTICDADGPTGLPD